MARERGAFGNVRGVGSLVAFCLDDSAARDAMLGRLGEQKLLALGCGDRSVRFRLPLMIEQGEVDEILRRVGAALPASVQA